MGGMRDPEVQEARKTWLGDSLGLRCSRCFLELESSLLTLLDLERELNWIKSTDRPYLTIEATVNELENRKRVVFDSVTDLINL